jgi:hypothetical protein
LEVTKVIAHRRGAESAKRKFLYKNLCVLCVSAVNQIKMIEFLCSSEILQLSDYLIDAGHNFIERCATWKNTGNTLFT